MNESSKNRQAKPTPASLQDVANRTTPPAPERPTTTPSVPAKPPATDPSQGFYKGVQCPNKACRSPRNRVVRTTKKENGVIVRERECGSCALRYRTEEKARE